MAKRTILNTVAMPSLFLAVLTILETAAATTTYVDDDRPADFHTIQAAIDESRDGDVIIVGPGIYTGDGNRNIDFRGKAITVRSLYPEDNACMRQTVIDAQGQGLIARFVNDEGPQTVFAGFTLVAGDTSIPVRGLPGFFEFSQHARPTTARLRIQSECARAGLATTGLLAVDQDAEAETPQAGPPYAGAIWDGNNPFHQPAPTTDYYGSGDVDNDGQLTPADVSLAQQIADGLTPPNIRADVDGDGDVNSVDVSLIDAALDGDVLPGWWNHLTDREQRNSWVSNFIAIEQTDKHLYYYDWFKCYHFAAQTYIHGAFHREDLFATVYDGGPTVFNLPIYCVSISIPPPGHGINAILVGDDPLDFDDWRFLEPQSDADVRPGAWNMPYGATVTISQFLPLSGDRKVQFFVDETGWTLLEYNPDLVLLRPEPPTTIPDNRPDLWNPRIMPSGQGSMLFERCREDMSRTTDIHIADLPFVDPPDGSALIGSSQYSWLLDICQGPDGTIHVLWTGKPAYVQGVFYGKLDLLSRTIVDPVRVSTGQPLVCMGRIIVTPQAEVHIFWLERDVETEAERDLGTRGIFWTKLTGASWQTQEIISLAHPRYYEADWKRWEERNLHRYYFDVAVSKDGDVVLVWSEPVGSTKRKLRQRCYDSVQWGSTIDIEAVNPRGVELAADSNGNFHLVYWHRCFEDRGSLIHQTSEDGFTWSAPQVVDANAGAACPRMVSGDNGELYLVWERKVGDRVVPVWSKYKGGLWYAPQQLKERPGYDSRYPTLDLLADGTLMVAWSSRSSDRVTIETRKPGVLGDLNSDERVNVVDFALLASRWLDQTCVDPTWCQGIDLDQTGDVDFADLTLFVDRWLGGKTLGPSVPVYFPDPNLRDAVERQLGVSNLLTAHMLALSNLNASYGGTGDPDAPHEGAGIADLTGLEFAANIRVLFLYSNEITDITALSGLTNLVELSLNYNQIHEIAAISKLTNLVELSLRNNHISDVSSLSKLTQLTFLNSDENQITDISALSGLKNLTKLNLRYNQINDVSPLFELINLTYLNLRANQISDVSPLSKLTQLTDLSLQKNQIADISALSGLVNLTKLWLDDNQINDISALSQLTQLTHLSLEKNQIADISALSGLTNLVYLSLFNNPLNTEAYETYIPLIQMNNPGISLYYDPAP